MPHALPRSFAFDFSASDISRKALFISSSRSRLLIRTGLQRGQRNEREGIIESLRHELKSLTGNTLKLAAARDKGTAERSLPFSREAHLPRAQRREHIKRESLSTLNINSS
jgi:hypothetical protein